MAFFNHQNFPEQFFPEDPWWRNEIEKLLYQEVDIYQLLEFIINTLIISDGEECKNFALYLTGMDNPDKKYLNIYWNKYMKLHEIIIEIEKLDINQDYTDRIYNLE